MSKFNQIVIAAAMTVTVLGSSMTPSQAAGAVKIAPIAAESNVANVHHRGWRRGYRPYYRPYYGHYRPYYRPRYRCYWTKRKVWSSYYGYRIWKNIRVCR